MLTKTTMIATVVLLVGGAGLAFAQTTTSPGTPGAQGTPSAQTQCWDAAKNQVRERSASAGTTAGASGNAAGTVGSASNGTMGSGTSGGSSGRSPSEMSTSKPSGMPNC
jgi:hypothetical protein